MSNELNVPTTIDHLMVYLRGTGQLPLAECNEIIKFALQVAKTEAGYLSENVFRAAVVAGAAMLLAVEEDKKQFEGLDVFEVCEKIRADAKLQTYFIDKKQKFANLMDMAMVEFEAAVAYNNSTVAGINGVMDAFSDIFGGLADKVEGMIDTGDVKKVLDIASAYGMDAKQDPKVVK